jgi:Xaa-Pro aminopeptidase
MGTARAGSLASVPGVSELIEDENIRVARLLDAQAKAAEMFGVVEERGLIASGVREVQASNAIRDLAAEMFGVDRYWHKRIVRAGPNTLEPYRHNPPVRLIGDDDIAFCDFGPIFEAWEADFGRTFVLGSDPVKARLRDVLPVVWDAGRDFFETHPHVTGEQLFAYVSEVAEQAGWEFGGPIAGHLIGQVPAREDRRRRHRVLHRSRLRKTDAACRPDRPHLPLDSRGPPRRPAAPDRRVLRRAARSSQRLVTVDGSKDASRPVVL